MKLPEGFCRRMTSLLGADAPAFFRALEEEPHRALRRSPDRVREDALARALGDKLRPVPFCENAYFFEFDGVGNLPLHHSGAIYVQEPAAMAPVAALPGEKVGSILDLCAAPGGKSLQAAARLLREDGTLVCNEPSAPRRGALMQNLERCGERRAVVTGFDGARLPEALASRFDLVICDAPCSGEGMMRKNEEAAERWSEEKIARCAALQREILESAARATAPGGVLLYSTCTWAPEEDEEQVAAFLAGHPEFSLIPPEKKVAACAAPGITPDGCPFDLSLTLRFYPHLFPGEGQFLAVFRKAGEPGEAEGEREPRGGKREKRKPKRVDPGERIAREFLRQVLREEPGGEIISRGEDYYLAPGMKLPQEILISPGLRLGSVRKGRFVPHHRLFCALGGEFCQKISLEPGDGRVEAYLRGEEIPLEGEGWAVLCLGESPLGGVKISRGRGKNFYPKGLRKGDGCTTS